MFLEAPPIRVRQRFPPLDFRAMVFPLEGRLHRRRVHQPIGLCKLGQATDGVAAMMTKKAAYPNAQDLRQQRCNESSIVAQSFEAIGVQTVGTVFRRPNTAVILLLNVLFGTQRQRLNNLHSLR